MQRIEFENCLGLWFWVYPRTVGVAKYIIMYQFLYMRYKKFLHGYVRKINVCFILQNYILLPFYIIHLCICTGFSSL